METNLWLKRRNLAGRDKLGAWDEHTDTTILLLFNCSVMSYSATPWTVALQAPLFMGFPKQEYWNGLPFPFPGDIPDPGIQPVSPALQVDSLPLNHQGMLH